MIWRPMRGLNFHLCLALYTPAGLALMFFSLMALKAATP